MKNTTYYFEPKKFHSLELEDNPRLDFRSGDSRQNTALAPELPSTAIEILLIDAPVNVIIDTIDLNALVWEHVKVPVCGSYKVGNDNYQKMSEHYVYLKDINTGETISALVDLDWYDGVTRRPRVIYQKGSLSGGTFVYNITYFTDLPKYSTEYEVWVKIADLESNHIRIKLDLKERGKLITELPKKD